MTLKEFAEKELELIGFKDTAFFDATINFLIECCNISKNDENTMKKICEIIPNLIDRKLLSPITEEDFETEEYSEGDKNLKIRRCIRYQYLYQMPNGKYYDDRAIAFRFKDSLNNDKMYLYQCENSSKQEVFLPYFPREEIRILENLNNIQKNTNVS